MVTIEPGLRTSRPRTPAAVGGGLPFVFRTLVALAGGVALSGCSLVARPSPPPAGPAAVAPDRLPAGDRPVPVGWTEEGVASWYGTPFHGRLTASGERYDMDGPTAAHPALPFGTVVEVHNLDNGRRSRLRINDRGPFVGGRIIDVSRHGARELGMLGPGTARVRLRVVESHDPPSCWQVQAGSFGSRDNAEARRNRLRADGLEAHVVRVNSGLHRVFVGPFDSLEQATEVADRLAGLRLEGC